MALVEPNVMLNSIMGKLYDVLTNGDDTAPQSEDNFFSWATPGIPVEPRDFAFLSQGLTGIVKKPRLEETGILEGGTPPPAGGAPPADGAPLDPPRPVITPELLEKLRAEDTAGLYSQAEGFARLVDFVPDVAANTNDAYNRLSVMNNEGSLSERYEYILRMSQVMEAVLPDDMKKKIEKFRGLLSVTRTKKNIVTDAEEQVVEPSPMVIAYNDRMAAYENKALEYNSRRIDALTADNAKAVHYWGMNANILRNQVKAAMNDWVTNGFKNENEQIAAFIDQVMQRDMTLLKAQYRDDLEKARLTGLASGSDFYYTSAVPGNFLLSSGWTGFDFDSTDYHRSASSGYSYSSSSTRAGGGFFGIFGGGGGASSASGEQSSHVQFEAGSFSMSFQICQVPIVRPWFKTSYLISKLWRFDQNNPEARTQMVSDGGNPPTGKLPAYPTSMICIKDLRLRFGQSSGVRDASSSWEHTKAGGGGVLTFGPFFLGGSHARASASGQQQSAYHYDSSKQEMTVDGYQIIGFKCHVFPKSPDPSAGITQWV